MRILVIGTGSIGRRHIFNLQALTARPEFVFLRAGARRDTFSAEIGAVVVGHMDAALAMWPDFAVIANPSAGHGEALIALMRAGIPAYIEKPVVTARAELAAVERALSEIGKPPVTLVGCNLRFLPSLAKMRALVAKGAVGVPARAHLAVGQWLPDWRPAQDYRESYSADPARGGGVVLDLIHEIDMARFLFGEFEVVQAVGGHYTALEIASEDAAAILLSRRKGPAVSIGLDYVARKPIRRYEIVGSEGTLIWDMHERTLTRDHPQGRESFDCEAEGFDTAETYRAAMRAMLDAVRTGATAAQGVADGLKSAELAILANETIRS